MEQVNTNISIEEGSKIINISGLGDEEVNIDYSGDVDFTELVSELTKCIDRDEQVNFSIPQGFENEKLIVVLNTIEDIFNKYNGIISEELDEGLEEQTSDAIIDDDLPF